MNARNFIQSALDEAALALDKLRQSSANLAAIDTAAEIMIRTLNDGGRVISCGNGGSMCDAMHFAEELSGKFRKERRPLAAMAISDSAHLSCTANDFGYDAVFSRFVEAHCRKGDVLLAISTSGSSSNVIAAANAAQKIGVSVITLTGKPESQLGKLATIDICTPGGNSYSDRIQELHIKVIHILIEIVERSLFPKLYEN